MNKVIFANEEYYHIYNRGVEKRQIFSSNGDYRRFYGYLTEFNDVNPAWKVGVLENRGLTSNEPLVEIVAYCINPNHFHLILRQVRDKGITEFMRKLGTGYTMYFNKRYERSGVLFQGKFKAAHIDSNEYLLYLSAYVNCNSEIHSICRAENNPWCSLPEYTGRRKTKFIKKDVITGQFRNPKEYFHFAKINTKEMKNKREMKELIIE